MSAQPALAPTPWRRRLRGQLFRGVLPVVTMVGRALPWRVCQILGSAVGTIGWHLGSILRGRDVRRTLDHLAIAFPEHSTATQRQIGRATYRHLGTTFFECLYLARRPANAALRYIDIEGWENVAPLVEAGRPVLLLTGHCGNWELIATLGQEGAPQRVPLYGLQRQLEDDALSDAIKILRRHLGAHNLPRGNRRSSIAMLRVIKRGGALVVLLDQDFRTDGIWVPFFGRLAHTPLAGAKLALRLSVPVVPVFSERNDDGRHTLRLHPPLTLPDNHEGATTVMTQAIENQIRRRPEQWVWMHRRWRRRPPEERSTSRDDPQRP